jgi:phage shock protein A
MGLMQRLSMVFKSKAHKMLDRAEDPRETLDYSYQRQLEMLQKVKRGVADVATSRKRVELQAQTLQGKAAKLHEQAKRAVEAGRDDLAREALSRRAAIQPELEVLRVQHQQLQTEEAKLVQASSRLQAKVDAFRTRKETIKATYTAAEAQARIGEAFSGISEEMGDVGLAIQRAEDKTAALQARAGAVDELIASGALDDVTGSADPIQAELDRIAGTSGVDAELAALKGEIGVGGTPAELQASDEQAAASRPEGSPS